MNANNFQRVGAISNAHVGNDFEELVREHSEVKGCLSFGVSKFRSAWER